MNAISFTATKPISTAKGTSGKPPSRKSAQRTPAGTSRLERTPKTDTFVTTPKKGISNTDLGIYSCGVAALGMLLAAALNAAQPSTKPVPFDYNALPNLYETGFDDIEERREAQRDIAKTYIDGGNVYCVITSEDGVTASKFCKEFLVSEETLRENNNLDWTYEETEPDENGYAAAYDTSKHVFEQGDLIRIPLDKIAWPQLQGMDDDYRGPAYNND